MKQFNLEEAKAGAPVCTKSGHAVRILCFDRKTDSGYEIIGLVKIVEEEEVRVWKTTGECSAMTDRFNLCMVELDDDSSCLSDSFIEKLADKILEKMQGQKVSVTPMPDMPWIYPDKIPDMPRVVMYGVQPTTFSSIPSKIVFTRTDSEDKITTDSI